MTSNDKKLNKKTVPAADAGQNPNNKPVHRRWIPDMSFRTEPSEREKSHYVGKELVHWDDF